LSYFQTPGKESPCLGNYLFLSWVHCSVLQESAYLIALKMIRIKLLL